MLELLPQSVAGLIDDHGPRALRYFGVSAFNVVFGLSTLAFFHGVLHWNEVPANVMSWVVGTLPAYLLSRRWVWQQSGGHSLHREVLPFWIIALVGLLSSTLLVGIVGSHTDETLYILLASLCAYGVVWVAKYFILDQILWSRDPVEHADRCEVG